MVHFIGGWRVIIPQRSLDQTKQSLVIPLIHGEVLQKPPSPRFFCKNALHVVPDFADCFLVKRYAFQIVQCIVARMVRTHQMRMLALRRPSKTRQVDRVDGTRKQQKRKPHRPITQKTRAYRAPNGGIIDANGLGPE